MSDTVPLFASHAEMRAAFPEPVVDGPPFVVVLEGQTWFTWRNVDGKWAEFVCRTTGEG